MSAQSKTASALWGETRARNTPEIVGKVFEGLARRMWRNVSTTDESDLVVKDKRGETLGIEAKASGREYCRLCDSQLTQYEFSGDGFVFNHLFYAIFFYKNPRCKGRGRRFGTTLRSCQGPDEIKEFLLKHCLRLFLIDHKLVANLRLNLGVQENVFPGDPYREALVLKQTQLSQMMQSTKDAAPLVGVPRRNLWIEKKHVQMPGAVLDSLMPVDFPLEMLGQKGTADIVLNNLDPHFVTKV